MDEDEQKQKETNEKRKKEQMKKEANEKRKAKAANRKGPGVPSGVGRNPSEAPKKEEGADKTKNSNDQNSQADNGQKTDKCIKQKS